jgi:hypothetical protein
MNRRYKKMTRYSGFLQCFAARPMGADELDGFLVGLNCRPEKSIPSEWKLLLFNSDTPSIHEQADLQRFSVEADQFFEETSLGLADRSYRPEFAGVEDEALRFRRFARWVDGFGRGLLYHAGGQSEAATQLLTPFISVLSMGSAHGFELADEAGAPNAAAMVQNVVVEVKAHLADDPEAARQFEEDGKNIAAHLKEFYGKLPDYLFSIAGR